MDLKMWLARLAVGAVIAVVFVVVAWWVVTPRMTIRGYSRALPSQHFNLIDPAVGAGSSDLAYFNLYYDVRTRDLEISGVAAKAAHWQFGAFDGQLRVIDGGYLNNHTVPVDDDGRFSVRVTADPAIGAGPGVLDCSSCPRGMIIYRVLLPEGDVEPPIISPA